MRAGARPKLGQSNAAVKPSTAGLHNLPHRFHYFCTFLCAASPFLLPWSKSVASLESVLDRALALNRVLRSAAASKVDLGRIMAGEGPRAPLQPREPAARRVWKFNVASVSLLRGPRPAQPPRGPALGLAVQRTICPTAANRSHRHSALVGCEALIILEPRGGASPSPYTALYHHAFLCARVCVFWLRRRNLGCTKFSLRFRREGPNHTFPLSAQIFPQSVSGGLDVNRVAYLCTDRG